MPARLIQDWLVFPITTSKYLVTSANIGLFSWADNFHQEEINSIFLILQTFISNLYPQNTKKIFNFIKWLEIRNVGVIFPVWRAARLLYSVSLIDTLQSREILDLEKCYFCTVPSTQTTESQASHCSGKKFILSKTRRDWIRHKTFEKVRCFFCFKPVK